MSEELVDDQSHYEVSLTAGQAFLAFVLLLLSLAASFAFGLLIGRGQIDERLTARKEPAVVVNEASAIPRKAVAREVPVAKDEDFKEATIKEEPGVAPAPSPAVAAEAGGATSAPAVPHFAQLLSTSDQKTAEALAAKLIDGGFTSAYVERGTTEKGMIFRVRVKFPSEPEARAAVTKLSQFSKDVWITK
jgi:cell division septation protein DedD